MTTDKAAAAMARACHLILAVGLWSFVPASASQVDEVCQADGTCEGTQGSAMLQAGYHSARVHIAVEENSKEEAGRRQEAQQAGEEAAVAGHRRSRAYEHNGTLMTDYPGVWMAGPFGKCSSGCDPAVKERPVVCRDFWHGETLNETHACTAVAPVTTVECFCEVEACDETPLSNCSATSDEGLPALPGAMPTAHFTFVGCFGLAAGDNGTAGEFEDYTCMNYSDSGSGKCRSGLPFFTNSTATTKEDCSEFCLGKGMDIFALVSDSACRCGASAINAEVWHGHDAPAHLLFDAGSLKEDDKSDICPLKVYRYTGYYDLGGVPLSLLKTSVSTTAYIDGLVAGKFIDPREEEEKPGVSAELLQNAAPWDNKPCYPENCGISGKGPWNDRWPFGAHLGGAWNFDMRYEWYIWVPYYLTDKIDSVRKEVWEAAAKLWQTSTCIVFYEVGVIPTEGLKVDVEDESKCYVKGIAGRFNNTVNLGFCKDSAHLGNVAHEIGHALGMAHEMVRMDAAQEYHGKGPYLDVHWDAIPSQYVSAYLPNKDEYLGSADDGPGDPHSGYAPYDFESIMHYAGGPDFSTIPSYKKAFVGQRAHLAGSDIMQILDLYQCKLKPGYTMAPTPAPSTVITISGACEQDGWSMNADYVSQGVTDSGAVWYKNKAGFLSLYFDSSCDGWSSRPRWILDVGDPNPSAKHDLDGDGACNYWAKVDVASTMLTYPTSQTWRVLCYYRYFWGATGYWWHDMALKIGPK